MTYTVSTGSPGPGSPSYVSASPLRSSPLSNPPVYSPSRDPSPSAPRYPSRHNSTNDSDVQPRPIPTARRRTSLLSQTTPTRPTPYPSQSPSPSSGLISSSPNASTPTSGACTNTSTPTSPSPPLSRSHPLLGSYPLSLLHSRMSHAHAPHSISPTANTGFSLHLGALGKGKSCPPELRCPPHEIIPFSATYYDLENQGRATQSPWVGNVHLENHYFQKYGTNTTDHTAGPSHTSKMPASPSQPPEYPGYRVSPVGQLQILVRTTDQAVKVFLVPYDLRSLPVGGRLLARERTFVQTQPTNTLAGGSTPPSMSPSSPSPPGVQLGAKEKLRYSFQLQFFCVQRADTETLLPRDFSTTRRSSRTATKTHVQSTSPPGGASAHRQVAKDYYVSKAIRVIFTSTIPEKDEITRTERHDEMVFPSDNGTGPQRGRHSFSPVSPQSYKSRMGTSLETREDWEVVRRKWIARREMERAALNPPAISLPVEIRPSTPPISLLSSQVISPPSQPIMPAAPTIISSPLPVLAPLPLLPSSPHRSRPSTPTGRTASPQPSSVKTPTPHRYPSRQKLRRGSGSVDERELSERLRELGLRSGDG